MVTEQRRMRQREQRRQHILEAARAIAAQDGWEAVTIRKVAERIEYSPPTIYEHFDSKDAMLFGLMEAGFRALLAEIQAVQRITTDPQAALLSMARVYWEFAWQQPELYQVMHGMDGVPFCSADGEPPIEAKQVFEEAQVVLEDLVRTTNAKIDDTETAVELIWATLHGIVSLTMSDHLEGGRERGAYLTQHAMQTLLAAWCGGSQP